jgi:heme/copper-type cytochrome/quinol oxidase subunit 2
MKETTLTLDNLNHQPPLYSWGLIIILFCIAILILFVPILHTTPKPVDRLIHIDASSFQFTPAEIHVNPGDRVTIEFVSTDVVHGISIDGYDFQLTSDPGQPARGTFVATKTGMFRFRCSIPCGNLHPFMIGKLHVGPNLLFIRGVLLGILAVVAAGLSLRKTVATKPRKIL